MSNGPIEFADLVAKRLRTVEIPVTADESITVKWSPDAMTPEVFANLRSAQTAGAGSDPFQVAATVIVPLVREWSIQQGGTMYPIETEPVGKLGLALNMAISRALNNDFVASLNPEGLEDTKDASVSP